MTATKYEQIWHSLEDEEYRREFNTDVDTGLAFQIKLLREKNGWTQEELAQRAGSKQETISQWENPNYGRYTLKTLKSLASAFDVGLMVRFVPFSELVLWNATLTPQRLAPPSFNEEQEQQASGIWRGSVAGEQTYFAESAFAASEPGRTMTSFTLTTENELIPGPSLGASLQDMLPLQGRPAQRRGEELAHAA